MPLRRPPRRAHSCGGPPAAIAADTPLAPLTARPAAPDRPQELLWPCPWSSILLQLLQLKRSELGQFLKLREDLLDFNMLPEQELLAVGGCVVLLDRAQLGPSAPSSGDPVYQIGLVGALREQPATGGRWALELLDGSVVPEAAVADVELLQLPKGRRGGGGFPSPAWAPPLHCRCRPLPRGMLMLPPPPLQACATRCCARLWRSCAWQRTRSGSRTSRCGARGAARRGLARRGLARRGCPPAPPQPSAPTLALRHRHRNPLQVLRSYQAIKLLRDLQPLVSRFESAFNRQLLGGRLAVGALHRAASGPLPARPGCAGC